MTMGKLGGNRQLVHERLRDLALTSWQAIQNGQPNPLKELIRKDPMFKDLSSEKLDELFNVKGYTGFAPARSREMAAKIKQTIS